MNLGALGTLNLKNQRWLDGQKGITHRFLGTPFIFIYTFATDCDTICGKAWKEDFRIGLWEVAKLFVKWRRLWRRCKRGICFASISETNQFVSLIAMKVIEVNLFICFTICSEIICISFANWQERANMLPNPTEKGRK